jgi:hypothetical protein
VTEALGALRIELARDHLRAGHVLRARAEGDSMWPLVRGGQMVAIEPCDGAALRVGDVALAALGTSLVLHRVVRADRGRVLLKGDACRAADGWVARADVLGRLARRAWDPVAGRASRAIWPVMVVARRVRKLLRERAATRA